MELNADSAAHTSSHDQEALWQINLRSREQMETESLPVREGEPDCSYYIRTGLCRFGPSCRFNHPTNRKLAIASARMSGEYPERIGQPECQYYMRTGTCKFGATCKFNHPRDAGSGGGGLQLNVLGYPLRPQEAECTYYLRTGQCKFGETCKYHHPQPSNMMISLDSPSVYTAVQTPGAPGQLSYGTSYVSSSGYAPLMFPQGVVPIQRFNTYSMGPVSPSESNRQSPGRGQVHGTSRLNDTPNMGSQGQYSSYQSASLPAGYYAMQRGSVFPERPGQPECQFYMKTGDCKFGGVCKFHHPRERLTPPPDCVLSPHGLPLRPGEPLCMFYSRYGICKFGPSCKFTHPIEVFSNLSGSPSDDQVGRHFSSSGSGTVPPASSAEVADESSSTKPRRLSSSGDNKIEPEE